MRTAPVFAVAFVLVGAAFAHTGVKNEAVKARMDAMSAIGAEMKVLGQMAKGVASFDGESARSAAAAIAKNSAATPGLFTAQEHDPMSEAKAEIWTDFADFTAKSDHLTKLASDLSQSIGREQDLAPALKSLGDACKACHEIYRE